MRGRTRAAAEPPARRPRRRRGRKACGTMWSVSLSLVCRILLAVVLAGSGIGKLQDLDDSRQMMVDFGLPYAVARPVGTFLPGIELAVALALLVGPTSWWGAWGAPGLLVGFTPAVG